MHVSDGVVDIPRLPGNTLELMSVIWIKLLVKDDKVEPWFVATRQEGCGFDSSPRTSCVEFV